jgi:hypothetical protein
VGKRDAEMMTDFHKALILVPFVGALGVLIAWGLRALDRWAFK